MPIRVESRKLRAYVPNYYYIVRDCELFLHPKLYKKDIERRIN